MEQPRVIGHVVSVNGFRLLDQVTVLAAGEAIVFGSALHVPSRVQIKLPKREPWSATATPYIDWAATEAFPLAEVVESWGLNAADSTGGVAQAAPPSSQAAHSDPDEEIPF